MPGYSVNSIWASDGLLRNLVVTLSAVGMQGQESAETKTSESRLVECRHTPIRPAAFIMERKVVKEKSRHSVTAEAFIEKRTNGENNRTIGYCSDDAGAIGMLGLFFFYLDMCIHVKEMSTKCQ